MNYRNARYIDATRIDCEIQHEKFGWIPYTLDPADTDQTINNDNLLAAMSANGDVAAYVPPTQAELDEQAAAAVRAERDMKLATEVDPIVSNHLRWNSMSDWAQMEYINYRQALLDVPSQVGFPHDIVWPNKPE